MGMKGERQRETDAPDRRRAVAHSDPPHQKHALALSGRRPKAHRSPKATFSTALLPPIAAPARRTLGSCGLRARAGRSRNAGNTTAARPAPRATASRW